MTYRSGAEKFYDLFGSKDDASFFIELAQKHGKKALELGVGTARLAIQLAREGIETWGVDNSEYMLRTAEFNIKKEPVEVQNRLNIEFGDVKNFDLGETFGLVYFPSYSFDHILNREEQIKALKQIRKHIAHQGVYAFDLAHVSDMKPEKDWWIDRRSLDETREVIRIGFHKTYPEDRIMSLNLWYELYEEGKMLERYFERGDVYIHTLPEIKHLLIKTGYRILAIYGGYDKQPLKDKSDKIIIIAQPSKSG